MKSILIEKEARCTTITFSLNVMSKSEKAQDPQTCFDKCHFFDCPHSSPFLNLDTCLSYTSLEGGYFYLSLPWQPGPGCGHMSQIQPVRFSCWEWICSKWVNMKGLLELIHGVRGGIHWFSVMAVAISSYYFWYGETQFLFVGILSILPFFPCSYSLFILASCCVNQHILPTEFSSASGSQAPFLL